MSSTVYSFGYLRAGLSNSYKYWILDKHLQLYKRLYRLSKGRLRECDAMRLTPGSGSVRMGGRGSEKNIPLRRDIYMTKRIAALTMVRNDEFFLRKWVVYYGRELGKGEPVCRVRRLDQNVPDFCAGVNVEVVEHVQGNVREADRGRIDLLSERADRLFARYDMVIGTDVDEFLVVDPLDGRESGGVPVADADPAAVNFRTRHRCGAETGRGGSDRRLPAFFEPARLREAVDPLQQGERAAASRGLGLGFPQDPQREISI